MLENGVTITDQDKVDEYMATHYSNEFRNHGNSSMEGQEQLKFKDGTFTDKIVD